MGSLCGECIEHRARTPGILTYLPVSDPKTPSLPHAMHLLSTYAALALCATIFILLTAVPEVRAASLKSSGIHQELQPTVTPNVRKKWYSRATPVKGCQVVAVPGTTNSYIVTTDGKV